MNMSPNLSHQNAHTSLHSVERSGIRSWRHLFPGAVLLVAVFVIASTAPSASAKPKRTFSLATPKQSVIVQGGQPMAIRINVKQSANNVNEMKYLIASKLKQVTFTKTEESSLGVTVNVVAPNNVRKQTGFVDVFAKSGGKAKKIRINIRTMPAVPGAVVNNVASGQPAAPVSVAVTTVATATPPAPAPTTPNPSPNPTTPTAPTAPPIVGDFTIGLEANSFVMTAGDTKRQVVTVRGVGGYSGSPTFTVANIPGGVTANFDLASSKTLSNLIIAVGPTAPRGAVAITVSGTDGPLVRTQTFQLDIKKYGVPEVRLTAPTQPWVAPKISVSMLASIRVPAGFDFPSTEALQMDVTTSTLPDPFTYGNKVSSFPVIPGNDFIVSVTTNNDVYVGVKVTNQFTKQEMGRTTHLLRVAENPEYVFTSGNTVTATTGLKSGTIDGNFSLPVAPANDIYGLAAPTFPPCTGDVAQLTPFISGSGSSWTLNLAPRGLAQGTYKVTCPIKTGALVNNLTATFVAKYDPIIFAPVNPVITIKP
jgi:hypothetical protein